MRCPLRRVLASCPGRADSASVTGRPALCPHGKHLLVREPSETLRPCACRGHSAEEKAQRGPGRPRCARDPRVATSCRLSVTALTSRCQMARFFKFLENYHKMKKNQILVRFLSSHAPVGVSDSARICPPPSPPPPHLCVLPRTLLCSIFGNRSILPPGLRARSLVTSTSQLEKRFPGASIFIQVINL